MNQFVKARQRDLAAICNEHCGKDTGELAKLSGDQIIHWLVATAELVRMRDEVHEAGVSVTEFAEGTRDACERLSELTRSLPKEKVIEIKESLLKDIAAIQEKYGPLDIEQVIDWQEEPLRDLFELADKLDLVEGLLANNPYGEQVTEAVGPVRSLTSDSPWLFIDVGAFVAGWRDAFDPNDLVQPLAVVLSKVKFDEVLWHVDAAGPIPDDILYPEPSPVGGTGVLLSEIVDRYNRQVVDYAYGIAAHVADERDATLSFKFTSPDGMLIAELVVSETPTEQDEIIDITVMPGEKFMGSFNAEAWAGAWVRYGQAKGQLEKTKNNALQVSLRIADVKDLDPGEGECLFVNDEPWRNRGNA